MAETQTNPTKAMFECLAKLYKQGQLLLMDADRLMSERGWESHNTSATAGFSYSLSFPERWYARLATRFYVSTLQKEEEAVDQLLFVSIHFAADHDTPLDEPIVSAGRLLYSEPMTSKAAGDAYDYWMCKWWFYGKPHKTLKDWRQAGQYHARGYENLKGSETFAVPLYDITASDKLQELIIEPLLAAEAKA